MSRSLTLAAAAWLVSSAHAATLFSNGPVVDAQGLSIQSAPYATTGVGVQAYFGNHVTDDFVVGGNGWVVTDLDFYAYKDDFTFTNVVWSIIAGDPLTGAVVASGDTPVTNGGQLGYRVLSNGLGATFRKIYDIKADVADVALAPGTYWLTWSLGATNAAGPWGPWQQPLTGDPRGNAMQSGVGLDWVPVIDPGAKVQLGLPFQINGSVAAVPEPSAALAWSAGLLMLFSRAAWLRRRAGAARPPTSARAR